MNTAIVITDLQLGGIAAAWFILIVSTIAAAYFLYKIVQQHLEYRKLKKDNELIMWGMENIGYILQEQTAQNISARKLMNMDTDEYIELVRQAKEKQNE